MDNVEMNEKDQKIEAALKTAEKIEPVNSERLSRRETRPKLPADGAKKKKRAGAIALIIGAVVCIAGLVFMLVQLLAEPGLRDAEYLVEVGKWTREDEPSVIWNFTEVGKGSLTTNAHENDFNFLWALDGKSLEVETAWLYTLNDAYEYKIDQKAKTLTLTSGEKTWTFVPVAE